MPDLDLSRRIVYPFDALPNAVGRRRVVYKQDAGSDLVMDVYAPAAQPSAPGSPALFFVHGGPIPREMLAPTEWGVFRSYGELAALSGLVAVVFNHRLHAPTDYPTAESDMRAAIDYARDHADDLGIDAGRIGVWAFSGGGPLLAWCLRERPAFVRCLLAFYAILDVRHLLPPDADAERVARRWRFRLPRISVGRHCRSSWRVPVATAPSSTPPSMASCVKRWPRTSRSISRITLVDTTGSTSWTMTSARARSSAVRSRSRSPPDSTAARAPPAGRSPNR